MANKKGILLIIFVLVIGTLVSGCQKKESPLYIVENNYQIDSTQNAYDYRFSLNSYWYCDQDNSVINDDCYKYINNENSDAIYVFKNRSCEEEDIQLMDLPNYMHDQFSIMNINHSQIKPEKVRKEYYNEFKFLHEYGEYDQMHYQAIYFYSDYSIPSVTGKKVINCILVLYDETSKQTIQDFMINLEKSIKYD